MSGLVLKLGPKERVLINGAVLENGDRRTRIAILTPNANILRLRDAIHPTQANTPVRRACYLAQLLLSGEVDVDAVEAQLSRAIRDLGQVFRDQDSQRALADALQARDTGRIYQCIKHLRQLLPMEARLMAAKPT